MAVATRPAPVASLGASKSAKSHPRFLFGLHDPRDKFVWEKNSACQAITSEGTAAAYKMQ